MSSRTSCILILYGVDTLCLAKIINSLSNINMIMAHAQQMFSKYSMTQWVIFGQGRQSMPASSTGDSHHLLPTLARRSPASS